jgi:cyanophycinase-like exopeptidase
LIVPDREAANDPHVSDIIGRAEAVFIAGGDQANYIRGWQNTAVQRALNAHIAAGKPIGGTSAGLAVLGEFVYSALNDPPDGMLASPEALKDPFTPQVALVRNFLKIPVLHDIITDSHFAKRDRLGRSLVFLARLMQDGWTNSPREIAVDERSAVLVEGDGKLGDEGGADALVADHDHGLELMRETAQVAFLACFQGHWWVAKRAERGDECTAHRTVTGYHAAMQHGPISTVART